MNYSFDDQGTESHTKSIQKQSNIILALVVAANVGYFGWQWLGQETYEDCVKSAAESSNGVRSAYIDLKSLCDAKNFDRVFSQTPDRQQATPQKTVRFDDLIPGDTNAQLNSKTQ